jgi:hypothetical protein
VPTQVFVEVSLPSLVELGTAATDVAAILE